jgi:hypothetical protein
VAPAAKTASVSEKTDSHDPYNKDQIKHIFRDVIIQSTESFLVQIDHMSEDQRTEGSANQRLGPF